MGLFIFDHPAKCHICRPVCIARDMKCAIQWLQINGNAEWYKCIQIDDGGDGDDNDTNTNMVNFCYYNRFKQFDTYCVDHYIVQMCEKQCVK